MKKNLLSLALCVLSAATLASCGGTSANNYAKNNTKFVIGGSGPLTGAAAVYGQGVKNAAQMAVDEINAAGGYKGIQFELKFMDDVHKADNASANYDALYEAGMQVSLGCVTSAPCVEYVTKAQADNVFCITPSATADGVPAIGDCSYQMCFSDSGQGTASATYISESWAGKKVGVLYQNDIAYSKGIYENFVKAFGADNIAVTTTFTSDTATDFSVQAGKLADCDVIFLPIYYTEAATFITQAKSTVKANAVYFGCDGLDGIDSFDKNFDVNSFTQEISYLSHFNSSDTSAAVQSFVSKYTEQFGTDTLTQFGAGAYDCVYSILAAMNAYSSDISVTTSASDFANIMKSVYQSSSFTFSGVTGNNMKWNADGTVSKTATKFVVNANRTK